jgi:hypothetical protein
MHHGSLSHGDVAAAWPIIALPRWSAAWRERRAGIRRQVARKVRDSITRVRRGRYVTVSIGIGSEAPAWGETDNVLRRKLRRLLRGMATGKFRQQAG